MHRPSWRWTLLNPLVTVLVAVVTIVVVTNVVGERWVNEPLHATMEAVGGMAAVTIAALLIWGRELHERPYLDWIAASLLVQGILDIVHAVTSPGATFYWSRTLPTVLGGCLFALVWLRGESRAPRSLYVIAAGAAGLIGFALLAFPMMWPFAFTRAEGYEPWAKVINQVATAPYAIATVFLLREQYRRELFTDGVFASYALLLALAAGAFGFSAPWDGTWWAFHVLRLFACIVSIGTVVELLQRVSRAKQAAIEGRLDAAHQSLERERETLRAVIMQAPLPMALYDKVDLRVMLANDAYINVMGGRDIRGRPLLEAVPELSERPTFHVLQDALRSGQPRSLPEYIAPVRNADGKLEDRYFSAAYQPLRSDTGEVSGLIVVGMEVTEQVRARQLIEQYARRMTVLVQASRAFSQAGLERQTILETIVSQLVEQSFDSAALHLRAPGTDRLDVVALRHRDPVLQAAMQQVLAQPLHLGEGIAGKVAQTGTSVLIPEVDLAAMRGAMKPEYVRFLEQYPIYGFVTVPIRARGEVIGTLSVTRFVKEPRLEPEDQSMIEELADRAGLALVDAEQFAALQRSEAAQTQAREVLESSLRFAEQFIGMLGHDLRNPLNAIHVAATLINETSSEAIKRYADRILASSKRISIMVTQLLDLTRTRLGEGIVLERKRIDFAQTIEAVLSELELIYPNRQVLRVTRGDTHGDWDPDRLARVVSNLVGNALQHGDPTRPVELRLIGDDGQLRIEVHNHGTPIPAEQLPTIFDPYRRSDARSRTSEGLGLGLYITQQIVLAHGGTIQVRSSAGEGTVFEVVLPRLAPDTL